MKPTPPGIVFGAKPATEQAKHERRARIVRAKRRMETATPRREPAVTKITPAQTTCLLALSRGEQPRVFPPITRNELLRKRWIAPSGRDPGAKGKRTNDITDAGRQALATSPHLGAAQRSLDDASRRNPVWQ